MSPAKRPGHKRPVEFLDLDDALAIATRLFGPNLAIRDIGLLGSALARPQTTVGGRDAYGSFWEKAAALLISTVNNHALVDGNKRLGWTCTAVFCEINKKSLSKATNDDVVELVMHVASTNPDVTKIADALEALHRGRLS